MSQVLCHDKHVIQTNATNDPELQIASVTLVGDLEVLNQDVATLVTVAAKTK